MLGGNRLTYAVAARSDEALGDAVAAARAADGVALLVIDVDWIKVINDEHGHPVGDSALVHLAVVLRRDV